jgi:hypothetical protein
MSARVSKVYPPKPLALVSDGAAFPGARRGAAAAAKGGPMKVCP